MPEDAKGRLRTSLQSCLRQTLLRLGTRLDMSEAGTTKLLSVPLGQLSSLVPVSSMEGLACAEQWAALSEALGGRRGTRCRRQSGILDYKPSLRVQGLSTVVHRPDMTVLLRCTACGHPLQSTWYFVHPRSGKMQVLTPQAGHWSCYKLHHKRCYYRPEDRGASITDIFTTCIVDRYSDLDFCEHSHARQDCVQCRGSACCAHGKRRRRCPVCAPFVKRCKKS